MTTMRFNVQVEITLREGVSDSQGVAIGGALPELGFPGVSDVRVGTLVRFVVEAPDEEEATARVTDLCDRFLANPAIHEFTFALTGDA